MNFFKNKKFNIKGFTMIELLIAMALFVILISIAITSFISVLRTQRAVAAFMEINDNASYALEQMSREIRTGKNFQDVLGGLSFENSNGDTVYYFLEPATTFIKRAINVPGNHIGQGEKITADNVLVQRFRIIILKNPPVPDRVTIIMSIKSPSSYLKNISTDIQTTVSQRAYNI